MTVLRIRPWAVTDESLILSWANDQQTRKNSLKPNSIKKSVHKTWFLSILKNPKIHQGFLCVNSKKNKLGIVRFSQKTSDKMVWEIHFTLAPGSRGKGLARPMIQQAIAVFKRKNPKISLLAKVKTSNLRSLHVLKTLGFQKMKKKRRLLCLRLKRTKKINIRRPLKPQRPLRAS